MVALIIVLAFVVGFLAGKKDGLQFAALPDLIQALQETATPEQVRKIGSVFMKHGISKQ